jgi:5'-3' exonuclease
MTATYVLVDASNLFHRAKHVTMGDAATKAGMALHICFNSLRQIWRKFGATHVVVALDRRSWRRDVYPDYKAHRRVSDALKTKFEQSEDTLYFDAMKMLVEFMKKRTNVTILESVGCEADDFIARWIDLHPDDQHVIFSGDSDFYQLLSDKVRIYDGVKGWTITKDEVLDENDKPAVKKKTVIEKITSKSGKVVEKKKSVTESISPPDPEYELFKKIIRGDSSDNIMSAKPGVRENGSKTKPGIREAYDDREGRGYDWTMFMQDEWEDHEGNTIKVQDAYKRNLELIDLHAQPDEIKTLMDTVILEAVQQPLKQGVGIYFLKFCEEMNLINIAKNPNDYAALLQAPYTPRT